MNPLSRKAVVFNGTVRALPLDTDYVAWGYREDLLVKFGLDKPETLEELVEVAEALHGRDLNDDGDEADWGMCINKDLAPKFGCTPKGPHDNTHTHKRRVLRKGFSEVLYIRFSKGFLEGASW